MRVKQLASLPELQSVKYNGIMRKINQIAAKTGLQQYSTYSRIWEYPWVWLQLESLKEKSLSVLDIGSGQSPFPWFLATQGFNVTVSDTAANNWEVWKKACQKLGVSVNMRVLDAQCLYLPTGSVDIYLSVSVIEHVLNKAKVIAEAARVLRPGGLLIMTFDICEPDMGMTFPKWNGCALTMDEFDDLLTSSTWFEPGLSELRWNTEDIPDYLAWNRTTAPWHNYVTGATVVCRNDKPWVDEPFWKNSVRILRGGICTLHSVSKWYLRHGLGLTRCKVTHLIRSAVQNRKCS
jgi:ubiquinone/menaquinone biosynthesis C-methylase UbiE